MEPLERAVSQILIPTITGHKCSQLERDVLSLPVRCGGLGFGNSQAEAARELNSSVETTAPLVDQIMSCFAVKLAKQTSRHKREEDVKEKVRSVYERAPNNLKRTPALSSEKSSSVRLSVVPLHELGFNLNKREFRDARSNYDTTGQLRTSLLDASVVLSSPWTTQWVALPYSATMCLETEKLIF